MAKTVEVNVIFRDNIDNVMSRVRQLENYVQRLQNININVRINSNATAVLSNIHRIRDQLNQLGSLQTQVRVQAQGVNEALTQVRSLREELNRLRSRNINVTVNTRTTGRATGRAGGGRSFGRATSVVLENVASGVFRLSRSTMIDYPRMVYQLGRSYYSFIGNIIRRGLTASFGFAGFSANFLYGKISGLTKRFIDFGGDIFKRIFTGLFGVVRNLSVGFINYFLNTPKRLLSVTKLGFDIVRGIDHQMRALSQAMYYFSQTVTAFSKAIGFVTGLIITGFVKLLDVMMRYKDYQYKLAVTTGIITQPSEVAGRPTQEILNAQLGKLTKLTDIAGAISVKTGMAFSDVVDLLYFVASSGFKTVDEVARVSEMVSKFAFATNVTPIELFRSLLAITGAYGFETDYDTLERTLAQLSYAVAQGVFTMGEFATQIQRVSSFAEATNTTFEETIAIMSGMSQAGLKPELIGTGLSQLLMQFARPDTIEKLRKYGIVTERFAGGEVVTPSVLEIIQQLYRRYGGDTRFWSSFARELKLEKRAQTSLLTIINSMDKIESILVELREISDPNKRANLLSYTEALSMGTDITFLKLLNQLQGLLSQAGVNFLNTAAKIITGAVTNLSLRAQATATVYKDAYQQIVKLLEKINDAMTDPEIVSLILDLLFEVAKLLTTLVRLALTFNMISLISRNIAAMLELLRPTTLFLIGFVRGLGKVLMDSGFSFGELIGEYVSAMMLVSEKFGEIVGNLIKVLANVFKKEGELSVGNAVAQVTYEVSILGVNIAEKVNEIVDTLIAEFEKHKDRIATAISSIILSAFSINLDITRAALTILDTLTQGWALAGKIGFSIARRLPSLNKLKPGTDEYKKAVENIVAQVKSEHYAELSKVYSDAEIDKMVNVWTEAFADFYTQLAQSIENITNNVLTGGINWAGVGFVFLTRFFEGINAGLQKFIDWAKTPEGQRTLNAFEDAFAGFVKEAVRFAFKFSEAVLTVLPSVVGGIAKGLTSANLPELFKDMEDEWKQFKASLDKNLPNIMASLLDILIFGLDKWDDVVDIFSKSLAKNSEKLAGLFYSIGELILSNTVAASELVKGAVKGFEDFSNALLNAPAGSELAKEWEALKNNIQSTASSFMKAALNFAILGAELGVSFFEGLSEGFKELEKDQSKLTRFHTAVQNAVKSAVKFSIQTLPETLKIGADILNGIADGVSQVATDQAYISKLQQAISDFVQAGLRAAISGAWLVTEFGKGFAQNLVAAIDLLDRAIDNQLDTLQYNSKEGVYTYTVKFGTETVTKQLTNSDIELLKQTAQNVKDTFRTFMSATPIALDWVTGFIKAMTGEAAAYTNFVRSIMGLDNLAAADKQTLSNIMRNAKDLTEFERQVNSAKWSSNQAKTTVQNYIQALKVYGEAVQRPIDQSVWQNLNESYANFKQAIINVVNTILNSIMITATIVIKDWLFEDKSNPKTTREYLEKLLEKLFATAFGVLWIASATGFNPAISLHLAVVITLTLASIQMGFDLFQAVRDAFKIKKEGIAVAKSPFLLTLERELSGKKATTYAERYKLVSSILQSAEVLNIFNNVSANIKGQHSRAFAESLLQAAKNIQSNLSNATQTAQVDQVLRGKGLFDIKGDFSALMKQYGNLDTISEQALNEFASLGGQLAYLEAMLFAIAYSRYGDVEEASKLTTSLISELINDIFRTFSSMKHFGVVFDAFMTEYASTSAMLQKFYDIEKSLGSKAGKYKGGYVGYNDGGYTGVGYTYDAAGIVHKGEYVVPKWMVQSYPQLIALLESIRLRGYADGGFALNTNRKFILFSDNKGELSKLIEQLLNISMIKPAEEDNRLKLGFDLSKMYGEYLKHYDPESDTYTVDIRYYTDAAWVDDVFAGLEQGVKDVLKNLTRVLWVLSGLGGVPVDSPQLTVPIGKVDAIALPGVILVHNSDVLEHERVHETQHFMYGVPNMAVLYGVNYALNFLRLLPYVITGGVRMDEAILWSYLSLPFEIEAREVQGSLGKYIEEEAKRLNVVKMPKVRFSLFDVKTQFSTFDELLNTLQQEFDKQIIRPFVSPVVDWFKGAVDWVKGIFGFGGGSYSGGGPTGAGTKPVEETTIAAATTTTAATSTVAAATTTAATTTTTTATASTAMLDSIKATFGQLKSMFVTMKDMFESQLALITSVLSGENTDKNVSAVIDRFYKIDFKNMLDMIEALINELNSSLEVIGATVSDIEKRMSELERKREEMQEKQQKSNEPLKPLSALDVLSGVLDILFGAGASANLSTLVEKTVDAFAKLIPGTEQIIKSAVAGSSGFIAEVFGTIISPIAGLLKASGQLDTSGMQNSVTKAAIDVFGNLFSMLQPILPILTGVVNQLPGMISSLSSVTKVFNWLQTIAGKTAEVLAPVIDSILAPFVLMLEEIGMVIGYMLKPFLDAIGTLLQALLLPVLGSLVTIFRVVGRVLYVIGGLFEMVAAMIYNAVVTLWNSIADAIASVTRGLISLPRLAEKTVKSFDQIKQEAENLFGGGAYSPSSSGYGVTSRVENINYTMYATLNFNGNVIGDREALKQLLAEVLKELNFEIGKP